MRKTRNKEAHNALLRQYIKEIENPDRHGFIGGKWVQSPFKGDDPNNRGYGIDVLQNKAAAKLTQGRQGKWLTEDEERMLRNKHIKDVNDAVNNHYYQYLRRTPLTEEKEIMATGLLYRGDHINGTKLAEPYYNGSNTDFQKAVEDYYRSKNLNGRAWRSKEFMDTHKTPSSLSPVSLESTYVPMEYVGYHPNEDYYYAGELPQVDAYGEHTHAEGGMLYGNQDAMSSTPQEDYQQGEQADCQVQPRQWDDLSMSEKNAFIANAVQHGITNMEDIKNAYNELMQEQLNDNDSMDDMEDSHKFLKGGYKPSRYIKNFISHMEGSSMKTNRSFEAEAKDFWNALPDNVKGKITQEQADALYSYSYNVGAGNFKSRVVPALQRYFSGNGSVEDVQRHMYATKDSQLRGLANRRAQERAMFAGSEVPVYYNEDYTPQSTNSQWRNSKLGPVTARSFNISQGLGPVSNTPNTLGPVTASDYMAQRNKENTEALANILYGSQPMTAFDAPQETNQETSGIDRYNEIQDLLSTPYTFAEGGEKNSGVTSTNGLYHASPSEYAGILDSVANNNPLEVTLPDTTVTVSDPRNYRSYYDPNGFIDFANIVTLGSLNRGSVSQDLGLVKDTYDAVKGKKAWKDVGLSAIMGNEGVFNNPYANLALDFAAPVGIVGASKAAQNTVSFVKNWRPYVPNDPNRYYRIVGETGNPIGDAIESGVIRGPGAIPGFREAIIKSELKKAPNTITLAPKAHKYPMFSKGRPWTGSLSRRDFAKPTIIRSKSDTGPIIWQESNKDFNHKGHAGIFRPSYYGDVNASPTTFFEYWEPQKIGYFRRDFPAPMAGYGIEKAVGSIRPKYDFYEVVREFNTVKPQYLIDDPIFDKMRKDWPLRGGKQIPLDIKRDAARRYTDFIKSADYLRRLKDAGMEDHWDYMKDLTNKRVNSNNGYFPGNIAGIIDNDPEALGGSVVEPAYNDYGINLQEDLHSKEIPQVINHELAHWATGNAGTNDIANSVRYPFRHDPNVSKMGDIMRHNESIVPNMEWEDIKKKLPGTMSVDEATKEAKNYEYLTIPQEKRARAYSLYEQAKENGINTDDFVDKYTKNGSISNDAPMELRQMGKILTPENIKKYLRNFLSLSSPIGIGYFINNNQYEK